MFSLCVCFFCQIPDEHVGQSQSPEIKALVYEKEKLQEKIFGIELDILSEKKWLLNTQIDIRKRELSGKLKPSVLKNSVGLRLYIQIPFVTLVFSGFFTSFFFFHFVVYIAIFTVLMSLP